VGEEPSAGEIGRRLDEIRSMLGGVVGHPEYAADRRALDYRLGALEEDLMSERREREAAVKAVTDLIGAQARAAMDRRWHWRELLWMGALPALATVIAGLVALLLSHGGH
jgi:hypothetical protein